MTLFYRAKTLLLLSAGLSPWMAWSEDAPSLTGSPSVLPKSATTQGKISEGSPEAASRPLKFKPLTTVLVGSTSNATLLNDPTSGSYAKVSPSLTADFSPSDEFFASVTASGSLKRFQDPGVGLLANETSGEVKSDLTWSLSDSWELGSNLSLSYLENHIPVVGTVGTEALPQRYYQPDLRLYGAWLGESWSLEVGTAATTRHYSTPTFDLQSNTYENTYDEYRADGKLTYRWSKNLRLSLKSTLERRTYTERMAEFSDGLPAFPGSPNPLLTTLVSENEAQLKARLSSTQLTSGLSFRFEKDQIFGARDSLRVKLREKASIPLPFSLTFEPEASVSKQEFSTFRSDPVNDPKGSPLRVDWDLQLRAPLSLALTDKINAQAQYALNRKFSNYSIQSFTENVVETGIAMQF